MALTQGRKTPCLPASEMTRDMIPYPVAAGVVIYVGGMVGINSSGYLEPMSGKTGLKCVGVAWVEHGFAPLTDGKFDNTNGANGAFSLNVRRGVQFFANLGSDPVVITDTLGLCYASDDYTVQHTLGTNSPAGIVMRVTDGTTPGDENYGPGVWVDVGVPLASFTTVTANNALAIDGVTVTGTPSATQTIKASTGTAAAWG